MHTVAELFDAARKNSGIPSDNKLADALGVARAQISQWRHGTHAMSGEHATRLAELSGFTADYVLLCLLEADAKAESVKKVLRHIAGQVKRTAAAVTLAIAGILGFSHTPPARAADSVGAINVYYGKYEMQADPGDLRGSAHDARRAAHDQPNVSFPFIIVQCPGNEQKNV